MTQYYPIYLGKHCFRMLPCHGSTPLSVKYWLTISEVLRHPVEGNATEKYRLMKYIFIFHISIKPTYSRNQAVKLCYQDSYRYIPRKHANVLYVDTICLVCFGVPGRNFCGINEVADEDVFFIKENKIYCRAKMLFLKYWRFCILFGVTVLILFALFRNEICLRGFWTLIRMLPTIICKS